MIFENASGENERTFDFRNASNMGDDKFWISENASADDEQWIFENALAIVMMNSKLRHYGLIIFFFFFFFGNNLFMMGKRVSWSVWPFYPSRLKLKVSQVYI